MATTYTNLGPIYLTQEKFNTLLTSDALEAGREYKIIDWEAQEKLVAGDGITIANDGKTISAQSGTNLTGTEAGQAFIYNGTDIIAQSGYGYESAGITSYTWDGNTDDYGGATFDLCNVCAIVESDDVPFTSTEEAITALTASGAGYEYTTASETKTGTFSTESNLYDESSYIYAKLSEGEDLELYMFIIIDETAYVELLDIELYRGIWFGYKTNEETAETWYQSKLSYAGTVVNQIDAKFIPKDETVVTLTDDQDVSGTKTFNTIKFIDGTGSGLSISSNGIESRDYHFSNTTTFKVRPRSGVSSGYIALMSDIEDMATKTWANENKQDKLIAGTGIIIDGNDIYIDDDSGIAIYDDRIEDADAWLTNGYTKTRNTTDEFTATLNLPSVCTGDDRWGVLLYVAENNDNYAGLQQYFPIDGTYKGRIFYRSVTGLADGATPQFGDWNIIPYENELSTSISSSSTDSQVPTAKAVYDYLQSLLYDGSVE